MTVCSIFFIFFLRHVTFLFCFIVFQLHYILIKLFRMHQVRVFIFFFVFCFVACIHRREYLTFESCVGVEIVSM